jgi:hypothetical protein
MRIMNMAGIAWLLLFSLVACGPSAEQAAIMTASAWTPTPEPSPTPTPVPYDLEVSVVDESGVPVVGVTLVYPASGSVEPVKTDDQGVYSWSNLPRDAVNLEVSGPGYVKQSIQQNMERGKNEIQITMVRDPYGLLLSDACAQDESLLYLEDFQDGTAQNWPEIDLHAQGWSVAEYPEEPGNLVASFNSPEHLGSNLQSVAFPDSVWRIRFRSDGDRPISFNWQQTYGLEVDGQHADDARYQIVVNSGGSQIHRLTLPALNIVVAGGQGAKANIWHTLEASAYQGDVQLWIDGQLREKYTDPKPLPAGGIGLEMLPHEVAAGSIASFDNISVCGLNAPFVSLYSAPQ